MGSTLDEDTLRGHAAYLEGILTYDELANLPRVDHGSLWYSVEAWFEKYVQERGWIREYNCMYRGERSLPYEATVDEFTERITYPFFTTPNCRAATYYAMDRPVYKLCIRPGTRYWFFSKLRVVERTNRLCHISNAPLLVCLAVRCSTNAWLYLLHPITRPGRSSNWQRIGELAGLMICL